MQCLTKIPRLCGGQTRSHDQNRFRGQLPCQQDGCEQMKNHVPCNTRQSCVFVRQLVDTMFGDNLCLGTIYGTCTTAVVYVSRDNYVLATDQPRQ